MNAFRSERYHRVGDPDHRAESVRDRDRLLFSYSLQRLGGVAQVASAIDGDIVHNRLTHTLEMAQLGRRLTELMNERFEEQLIDQKVLLDPDVVEAACLAHDLGHPPFGHSGEEALNSALLSAACKDGFEGNAQSFRILNEVEPYRPEFNGLNLTRATLLASVKYPRYRNGKNQKWGWYQTERRIVDWIGDTHIWSRNRTEASIMDMADDIAYGAHDLLDFVRAKFIPLYTIRTNDELVNAIIEEYAEENQAIPVNENREAILTFVKGYFTLSGEYQGARRDKAEIRLISSQIIKHFRERLFLTEKDGTLILDLPIWAQVQLGFLKHLTRKYVQRHHQIATQRVGFKMMIKNMFQALLDGVQGQASGVLGNEFRELLYGIDPESEDRPLARIVCDYLCTLTDKQALTLHRRLSGSHEDTILSKID